jgi:hypothetical protein
VPFCARAYDLRPMGETEASEWVVVVWDGDDEDHEFLTSGLTEDRVRQIWRLGRDATIEDDLAITDWS